MDHPGLALVLVALAVLSGCAGLPVDDGTPPGDAAAVESGTQVTVTAVIDGDTIEVRYANGTSETVRLLGVDTPETHAENDPAEFEGVPDTDAGRACLAARGENATRYLTGRLLGESATLEFDAEADRRGYYGRLLAYVAHDDENLNYRLVADGHSRVYDSQFTASERFYAAEERAQANATGVWACAGDPTAVVADGGTGPVAVAAIHADADGPDGENLTDEYVVLENRAGNELDLAGWTVTDEADHTYTFPADSSLPAGETVTLRTGTGSDGGGERYWSQPQPVWNNGGDTVTVRAENGTVVARRSYDG